MPASACRQLMFLAALALMMTGAPSLGQGRHYHHGDEPGARNDEQGDEEHGRPKAFAVSIDEMIHACAAQAAAFRQLPPEAVVEAVQLTDDQRAALEQIRASAGSAAQSLDANCPQSIPAKLDAKLDTLGNMLNLVADALSGLRPAVVKFHALLSDEQKGRLIAMTLSDTRVSRSGRTGKSPAAANGGNQEASAFCSQWAAILRTWPVKQLDAGMQLSDGQRAALYEVSAAIFRSAGDLVEACPMENPITPLARLDARRDELQALRQDIDAIRPSAAAFESRLNEVQRRRLAEAMDSGMHVSGGKARDRQAEEIVAQSSANDDDGNHHAGLKAGRRSQSARGGRWGFAFVPHWRWH
jgi:hypothetical protein